MNDLKNRLMAMHFTSIESDIYVYLLQHGRSTGYAVAKAIGKAVANTYNAVESLRLKGAIEVTNEGKSRLCRAVPWQHFLKSQKKAYNDNIQQLEEALKALPQQENDEAVYQLDNVDQVIATAISTIQSAKKVIFADIEPLLLPKLQDHLIKAAARGIEVRIKIYEVADLPGVHITLRQRGAEVYARTRDVSFHINADGEQDVMGLFSLDMSRVLQAFHTESALMNMSHYCGLLYELILTDVKQNLRAGDFEAAIKNLDDTDHLHPMSAEGPALEGFERNYDR